MEADEDNKPKKDDIIIIIPISSLVSLLIFMFIGFVLGMLVQAIFRTINLNPNYYLDNMTYEQCMIYLNITGNLI